MLSLVVLGVLTFGTLALIIGGHVLAIWYLRRQYHRYVSARLDAWQAERARHS